MGWASFSSPLSSARLSRLLTRALIGSKLYPQSTAEAAAAVVPVNYAQPSDTGTTRSSRYVLANSWDYRHDQRLFEMYLSKYGAVFNGATDDGPAIADALNALTALGGYRRQVIMPAGGLTAKINSGFTILTGAVGIDFNGLKIDASGITAGTVISIDQSASAAYNPDSTVTAVRNLYLLGNVVAGNTPTMLAIDGVTSSVNNVLFENLHIIGGQVGIDLVQNFWLLVFQNVNLHSQMQYGVQYTGTTNCGESILWQGGGASNVTNLAKTGTALYFPEPAANSNNQLNFVAKGASFDGCDQVLTLGQGTADFIGCNFEGVSGTGAVFAVSEPSTGPQAQLGVHGGSIDNIGGPTSILSISGGERACADIDCDIELWNNPITVIERTGNCTVKLNLKRVYFGGATAAGYPSIGQYIAANYNGNFELDSTVGWSFSGAGIAFAAQSVTVHSGTYAGMLTATAGATGGAQTNNVRCNAGEVLTADIWAYATALSAGSVSLQIDFLDAGGNQVENVAIHSWAAADAGWNRYTLRSGVPTGAQQAVLKLYATAATGTVAIDDVYLHVG